MSVFDTDAFMNAQFTEALDTQYVPAPEGEYPASVKEVKTRTTDKGNVILDVTWETSDDSVREATGLDTTQIRQSIFLDVSPNGGLALGPGKNVQLGRLRAAVGQNKPGQAWGFGNLVGAVAIIKVKHRTYEKDGEQQIAADVKGVAAL